MLKRIEIRNFKRAGDFPVEKDKYSESYDGDYCLLENKNKVYKPMPLLLNNLAKVNWIVGENGSGKTTVLDGFSYINDPPNSQKYFEKNSLVEVYDYDNNYYRLVYPKDLKEGIGIDKNGGGYIFKCYVDGDKDKGTSGTSIVRNYSEFETALGMVMSGVEKENAKHTEAWLKKFNIFLLKLGFNEISLSHFADNYSYERFILQNDKQINLQFLAGGLKKLFSIDMIIEGLVNADLKLWPIILIAFEEPEHQLHPKWQKLLPNLMSSYTDSLFKKHNCDIQFIISTHSPFIINAALELDGQNVYHIQDGICLNEEGYNKETKEKMAISGIHSNLGMLPSDLFFSNSLIWVEGPTDAIYINFWLDRYIEEKVLPPLNKGIDYEFALLGGASAQNFYLLPDDYKFDYKNDSKIFDMLKIHPNSFVIVDNDGGSLKAGVEVIKRGKLKNIGKSKFEDFKQQILDHSNKEDYWYDTNSNNFTIECYRKDFDKKVPKLKKDFALSYCKDNKEKKFSDITNSGCEEMIQKLYKKITKTI